MPSQNRIETHVMVPSTVTVYDLLVSMSEQGNTPHTDEKGNLFTFIKFGPENGPNTKAKLKLADVHQGRRYLVILEGTEGDILEFCKRHFKESPSKLLHNSISWAIQEKLKAIQNTGEPEAMEQLGHA